MVLFWILTFLVRIPIAVHISDELSIVTTLSLDEMPSFKKTSIDTFDGFVYYVALESV